MSDRIGKRAFASRPSDPESWIKSVRARPARKNSTDNFTARLTVDITPALRGRIKIAAFQRGETVADMLRDLLVREFPAAKGETA